MRIHGEYIMRELTTIEIELVIGGVLSNTTVTEPFLTVTLLDYKDSLVWQEFTLSIPISYDNCRPGCV